MNNGNVSDITKRDHLMMLMSGNVQCIEWMVKNRKMLNITKDDLKTFAKYDTTEVINSHILYDYLKSKISREERADTLKHLDFVPTGDILNKIVNSYPEDLFSGCYRKQNLMNCILNYCEMTFLPTNILIEFLLDMERKQQFDKNIFNVIGEYNGDSSSFNRNVDRYFYMIYPSFTSSMWKKIKMNPFQCNGFINNESLLGERWIDVFSDSSCNKIVYHDVKSNYGFVIDELLEHWNNQMNCYDRIILPSLPTNPYTNNVFDIVTVYEIVLMAVINKIEIPETLGEILKYPEMMLDMYFVFQYKKDIDDYRYELAKPFREYGFKYVGGSAETNEPGRWISGSVSPPLKEHSLKIYMMKVFRETKYMKN